MAYNKTPPIRVGYKRKNLKMRWVPLKSLEYPVFCGSRCVLPKGTDGVECAFNASHLQRYVNGKWIYMNVYRHNGMTYHA